MSKDNGLRHYPRRSMTGSLEIVDREFDFVRVILPYDSAYTSSAQQYVEADAICRALDGPMIAQGIVTIPDAGMLDAMCRVLEEDETLPPNTLTDGSGVPHDGSHREIDIRFLLTTTRFFERNGVLSDYERAKGFVQPYRDAYKHVVCDGVTIMTRIIAETYARDPFFYTGTFCSRCCDHFPLKEFKWSDGKSLDPEGDADLAADK